MSMGMPRKSVHVPGIPPGIQESAWGLGGIEKMVHDMVDYVYGYNDTFDALLGD